MATFDDVAENLARYIRLYVKSDMNLNNPMTLDYILKQINLVTYSSTGSHLSNADIEKILRLIEEKLFLSNESPKEVKASEDSSKYREIMIRIRTALGPKK